MRKKLLRLLVVLSLKHPVTILVIVGIVSIIALIATLHLTIETDVTALLPANSPVAKTLTEALNTFRAFDFTLVVLEANEPHQSELLTRAAETLAPALDNPAYIYSVDYKLDPRLKTFYLDRIEDRLSCLLNKADLEAALERFAPDNLHKYSVRLARHLQCIGTPETKRRLLEDPLDLGNLFRQRLIHSRGPTRFTPRNGYFLSEDGKVLLMILCPLEPSSDLKFSTELVRFLEHVRAALIDKNPAFKDKVSVGYLGSHIEAVSNARIIRTDLFQTLLTSFIGVLLLFLLVFRHKEALIFVGLPLFVGILWTLGLTQVVIGRLTVVTFAFGAVLIGLGIDFAIHIYNRFLEERRRSDSISVHRALETALVETGEGVLIGAITTAAAFYGMFFTSFRGFKELGFVAGSGILACLIAIFLLLPVLVLFVTPKRRSRRWAEMTSFGLPRLYRIVMQHPRLALLLGLMVTVYFAYQARYVKFDENFRALKQPSRLYSELRRRLADRFSLPSNQIIGIVSATTLQGALEKNDRLYENLENQKKYPVLSCDTLRTFLPSIKTQRESRKLIRETIGAHFPQLKERLIRQGRAVGLSPRALEPFLTRLLSLKAAAESDSDYIRYEDMKVPFMIHLVQKYLVKKRQHYRVVTQIFPPAGQWRAMVPPDFLYSLKKGIGTVEFTGVAIVADAIQKIVKHDLAIVILLVAGAVFLLLVLYFGRMHKACFAIFPVACGGIWMLGTMRILGIELNFLNVVIIPMIVGVGVDNGIHLIQRFYERGENPHQADLRNAMEETGRALVITALTTIVGFGSLALADFRGIREMGLLSIFGIAYTLFAALFLLPALLKIWSKRHRLTDFIGREEGEIR